MNEIKNKINYFYNLDSHLRILLGLSNDQSIEEKISMLLLTIK